MIKMIKGLYRRKERRTRKLFLIEGIKMIGECLDNDYPMESIIYCDGLLDMRGGEELFERIRDDRRLFKVSNRIYEEISDMETPQGILGIARFESNSTTDIEIGDNPFILLLDRVQDPGNMGAIIRTSDAFGIDGIIVTNGCVDTYNPKVVRATMGSIFRVPIYGVQNEIELINMFKDEGMALYVTALEGSMDIREVNFIRSCMLVIGNESSGVSRGIMELADNRVKIPMSGGAESLNVAVASSIIMYEGMRQRAQ